MTEFKLHYVEAVWRAAVKDASKRGDEAQVKRLNVARDAIRRLHQGVPAGRA